MKPLSKHGREILECLADGKIIAAFSERGLWCSYDVTVTANYSHHHTVWVTPFRALIRRGAIEEYGKYPRGDRLYRLTAAGAALLDASSTDTPAPAAAREGKHE